MELSKHEAFRRLRIEFSELSTDIELIENSLRLLDRWLSESLYASQNSCILAHIERQQYLLLLDSFYQSVPFGTGGRRGRVGYGPNRINDITVALSVQGHCNYIRHQYPGLEQPKVVVAFDTRIFLDIAKTYDFLGPEHPLIGLTSRRLAHEACEIYAGNGFISYVAGPHSYLSTPELSFDIRYLSAVGGVNMSASHNHPDDNGFKFFNAEGAQDVPPTDESLASFMDNVQDVRRLPFEAAVDKGYIRQLPPKAHDTYLSANRRLIFRKPGSSLPIIYTPLCGTGHSTVGDLLRSAGYNLQLYAPQANFDGTFATVPSRLPNPEIPEAARPALEEADRSGAPIVLFTDPDADRLGVYAKEGNGTWRYLTGNDIGSILAYYLVLDKERGPRKSGLILKTIATTRTIDRIAEAAGCEILSDLLIGFKYIADVLGKLDSGLRYRHLRSRSQDLVLAAEESHGFLLVPDIRDKDAAGAALVLCELASQVYQEGYSVPTYLDSVRLRYGNYANAARSIVMRGIRGAQNAALMIRSLRKGLPRRFGEFAVLSVEDFLSSDRLGPLCGETDRQARNLLLFTLDGARVIIRPSGTEPKVKIYVEVEANGNHGIGARRAAEVTARTLAEATFETCIDRVGVRLSSSARLLPDQVDLDLKAEFDREFRPELLAVAEDLVRRPIVERIAWLRRRLSAYGAGADPVESAGLAVRDLCAELAHQTSAKLVREALLTLDNDLGQWRQSIT